MRTTSMTLETVQGNLLLKQDPNINADDLFSNGYVTISPAWLDWRGTRSVRQELFRSLEKDDQIASARSFSTSRRRRSSRIQNLGTDVSFRIYVFSVLVNSNMAELFAKRRRSSEEISVVCGSILCWYHRVPSNNSRPLWRKTHQSYIARQRVVTERLHRAHLLRWKRPRYVLDQSIWIDSGWQRRQERETCGVLHGREPSVQRSLSREGLRRDEAQDCRVQTQKENTPKTHCIGVIWGLLRAKDCSSIKRDQTRSSFTTLYFRFASRRWWSGSQEKNCTPKRVTPTAPQRIVLKPNLHCGRQDTTCSDARTSFDHSDKHGGMYREICRGEIAFRIQGLPHSAVQEHDHIRKQAVQKLIHQFENHPNKEALQEDLQQKSAFNPFSEVEGYDLQHGKHGVLRDLRHHSKRTVPQLCDILAERYCILHMRNMLKTFRQSSKTQQWPLRRSVNPQLRH